MAEITSPQQPELIPHRSSLILESELRRKQDTSYWLVFARALAVVLAGYLLFDRAFAWIHIPGTPVFLGEILLVFGVISVMRSRHPLMLVQASTPMKWLMLYLAYGLVLTFLTVPEWGQDAVRDSALWYYAIFAMIGGVMVLSRPSTVDFLIKAYAWIIPIFAVVGFGRLAFANSDIGIYIPDSVVNIASHKTGNLAVQAVMAASFILLVLLPTTKGALAGKWRAVVIMSLVLFLAAGTQSRGGFVAGLFVLGVLFALDRAVRPLLATGVVVLLGALVIAYVADVSFELERREVSVRQLVNNVSLIVLGSEASTSGSNETDQRTVAWRIEYWGEVLDDIASEENLFFGFGPGPNLAERYDREGAAAIKLRNPHNSHLGIMARMGAIGLALWVILLGVWYRHMFRARARLQMLDSVRDSAIITWSMVAVTAILINAFFDPTIESPQVAIWLWLIIGISSALALKATRPRTMAEAVEEEELDEPDGQPPELGQHPVE